MFTCLWRALKRKWSPSVPKISRDILKQFLPNHETIIAFENLLNFMDVTSPTQMEELLELVSGAKRINATDINNRIAALEVPMSRGRNTSAIESSLSELGNAPAQRANLSSILTRLDDLELMQRRSTNTRDIVTRLENIEKFLGI